MKKRWVAVGMLEAERSFRRIKGCAEMPTLVAAIRREVNRRTAIDETVTPLSTIRLSPEPDVARPA